MGGLSRKDYPGHLTDFLSFRSMQTVWFTVFNMVILDSSLPTSLYVLDQSWENHGRSEQGCFSCVNVQQQNGLESSFWFKKKKGDSFVSYLIKQ